MTNKTGTGVEWDLSSYFAKFNCPEMLAFRDLISADIAKLQADAASLKPLMLANFEQWERIVIGKEDVSTRLGHLSSYVECLSSANSTVAEYSAEEARIQSIYAELTKLDVELLRAFRIISDDDFAKFLARPELDGAQYQLGRIRHRACKSMEPQMEKLTADLLVNGFHSWMRLYDNITGKLEFEMKMPDGTVEKKPISQWRSLMSDANRDIGRAAFEGGNKAWESIQDTAAAILNSISGTRLTLNKYRGIEHFLDVPLFQSGIKRETLNALFTAIKDNVEMSREVYRIKAEALGRKGIYFFEREAPLDIPGTKLFSWEEGTEMVGSSFGRVYPKLADHYNKMLKLRWIESQQRAGKRPGAFCTGSELTREQRIYMTYNKTLNDISTVAHEVGHAFHNEMLSKQRPYATYYPATLAETASIFAELIFTEGVLSNPDVSDTEKLLMLDGDLTGAAILLLDIPVRFEFERKYHEERMNGELSVARFKEIMVETQRELFGDSLLDGAEDPCFWISKLHFYLTGITFYNYPYVFGFLLARKLFGMLKAEGSSFLPRYEEFLRLTGQDTAESVVMRSIGEDITKPEFWASAIRSYNQSLETYRSLVAKL